jgi:hypothetical protein
MHNVKNVEIEKEPITRSKALPVEVSRPENERSWPLHQSARTRSLSRRLEDARIEAWSRRNAGVRSRAFGHTRNAAERVPKRTSKHVARLARCESNRLRRNEAEPPRKERKIQITEYP